MRYKYQPGGSIDIAKEGQRLRELGYSDEQIMEIIGFEQPNALAEYMKNKRESMDGYMSPNINPAVDYSGAIRGQLENAGYSEEDIEKIIGYDESTGIYTNPVLERFSRSGDAPDSEYMDLLPNLTSSTSSIDDEYISLRRQGYTDLSAEKILEDKYGRGYQPDFRRRPEGVYNAPLLGSVGETGQFLTDTFRRFFGGRDRDGDGFRDGSLRDLRRKSTFFDVEIDPNDPNKDNYVYDFDFLNQGKLPTKEEYGQYLQDNTFLDYNTRTGDYDISFKRPGKSYFDEDYEPRNRRNKVSLTDFTSGLSDRERAGFEGLGIMPEASTFEISDGATIFYEPGEDPRSKKDIRKTMMGQFEQPSTAQSSVLQPEDSGVMGPMLPQERYGGGLRFYDKGGEEKDSKTADSKSRSSRIEDDYDPNLYDFITETVKVYEEPTIDPYNQTVYKKDAIEGREAVEAVEGRPKLSGHSWWYFDSDQNREDVKKWYNDHKDLIISNPEAYGFTTTKPADFDKDISDLVGKGREDITYYYNIDFDPELNEVESFAYSPGKPGIEAVEAVEAIKAEPAKWYVTTKTPVLKQGKTVPKEVPVESVATTESVFEPKIDFNYPSDTVRYEIRGDELPGQGFPQSVVLESSPIENDITKSLKDYSPAAIDSTVVNFFDADGNLLLTQPTRTILDTVEYAYGGDLDPMYQFGGEDIPVLDPNRSISSQTNAGPTSSEADRISIQDAMNKADAQRAEERGNIERSSRLDREARALGFDNYAEYLQAKQQEDLFGVTDNTYTTQADNLGMYDDIYLPEIAIQSDPGKPTVLGSEALGSLFSFGGAEALPFVGEGIDALMFADALKKGNFADAGLYGAGFLLPFVPGAALKKFFRGKSTPTQRAYTPTPDKLAQQEDYLKYFDQRINEPGYIDGVALTMKYKDDIRRSYNVPRATSIYAQANLREAYDNAFSRAFQRQNSPEAFQTLLDQGLTPDQARTFVANRNRLLTSPQRDLFITRKPGNYGVMYGETNTTGINEMLLDDRFRFKYVTPEGKTITQTPTFFGDDIARRRQQSMREATAAHEVSHRGDVGGQLMTPRDYDMINDAIYPNITGNFNQYLARPTEVRARINALRDFTQQNPNIRVKDFEIPNNPFLTPGYIRRRFLDPGPYRQFDDLKRIMSPDQIDFLYKGLSQVEPQQGMDVLPMAQFGLGVMDETGLLDDQELILPMSNAVSTANPNFFPQSIPDFTQGVSIQDPGMPTNAMFERAGISIPETPTLDNIQPFTMEQVDAEFANVPEPAFVAPMVDADGDGIPDYIDADAGTGTSNYDQPQIDKKRRFGPTFRRLVGDVGETAVGGARLLNKYFEDVKARRAERDLKDIYGVAENVMPIAYSDQPSRGISSELTGDIGSEADRYTYLLPAKEGREVTVDDATLLKLMQLGAEIEIL